MPTLFFILDPEGMQRFFEDAYQNYLTAVQPTPGIAEPAVVQPTPTISEPAVVQTTPAIDEPAAVTNDERESASMERSDTETASEGGSHLGLEETADFEVLILFILNLLLVWLSIKQNHNCLGKHHGGARTD